jgi:hypothetical protein
MIRADLVIIVPLLTLAWLEAVGLTIYAAAKASRQKEREA